MKYAPCLVLCVLLGACACLDGAADPSHFEMSMAASGMTDFFAPAGSAFSTEVEVDLILNTFIDDVCGWMFGVMADPDSGLTLKIVKVSLPEDLTTVNMGSGPGYMSLSIFAADDHYTPVMNCSAGCGPINADAITQSIYICSPMIDDLDAHETNDFKMLTLTVLVEGIAPDAGEPALTGSLVYTDSLGDPATETLCVQNGNSYFPAVQDGLTFTLEGRDCIPATQMTIEIEDAQDRTGGEYETRVLLHFDSDPDNPNTKPIVSWSYSLCVTDTEKITIDSAVLGADSAVCRDGLEPGFVSLKFGDVYNYQGLTIGLMVDLNFSWIDAQNDWEDLIITGTINMTEKGDATYIVPCSEGLGDPAVPNCMVFYFEGNRIYASSFEGTEEDLATADFCNPNVRNEPARISLVTFLVFTPGDINNDGFLDLADGIYLLNAIFRGGPALPCEAAGDFNNDGVVDLSDAVGIIYWQFQPVFEGAPEEGYPGPALGMDCREVDTPLSCEASACDQSTTLP